MAGPLALNMVVVGHVSWADANRFGPGYLNGWAFGPKRGRAIPGQRPMRSHSLAQSGAAGQVCESQNTMTGQRPNRSCEFQ